MATLPNKTKDTKQDLFLLRTWSKKLKKSSAWLSKTSNELNLQHSLGEIRGSVDNWRKSLQIRPIMRHFLSVLILIVFGLLPLPLFGLGPGQVFPLMVDAARNHENLGDQCEASLNRTALQDMLSIDVTTGGMSFGLAKLVDIVWDFGVSRLVQLAMWLICYRVFTNALLRSIERSPTSYRVFIGTTLETGSVTAVFSILRELPRMLNRHNKAVFICIAICSLYVLLVPALMGAMTGYISITSFWLQLPDGSVEPSGRVLGMFIDASYGGKPQEIGKSTGAGFIIQNASGTGLPDGYCLPWYHLSFSNSSTGGVNLTNLKASLSPAYILDNYQLEQCGKLRNFNELGPLNAQTTGGDGINKRCPESSFTVWGILDSPGMQCLSCDLNYTVSLPDKTITISPGMVNLKKCDGACHDHICYSKDYFDSRSQCLPDASGAYAWGFALKLTTIFLALHCAWSIVMYALWLDSQCNSELVRSGYRLSHLKAIFALTTAARQEEQFDTDQLHLLDQRTLDRSLLEQKRMIRHRLFLKDGMEPKGEDSA